MRIVSYFIVGILWGCTNPFIKRVQGNLQSKEKDKDAPISKSTIYMIKQLLSNPILAIPFAVNQLGSFLFYFLLANGNVSITSPVCNALAVVFTALTGWVLGEKYHSPLKLATGVILVYAGVLLCAYDSTSG